MTTSTIKNKNQSILIRGLRGLGIFVVWIGVWQIAAMAVGQELLIPTPLATLRALAGMVGTGGFWLTTGASLLRILLGYLAGVALGVLLAVVTVQVKVLDRLLSPVIRVIRAMPVASFIMLCLLWMGKSRVPAFAAMLMVMPVVWAGVAAAIRQTDPDLVEAADSFNLNLWHRLRYVYLPSILPAFGTAALTGMGLAWKSGIAAEVLSLPGKAIGTGLYHSKIYLETPQLFAWTITVIVLSFMLEKGVTLALGRISQRRATA